MSLVISMGFGIDQDSGYQCPFTVTLDIISELEGTLTPSSSLSGCLVESDSICGTLISTETLIGTLVDETITGTLECN